jgi:hypothetical protein
MLSASSEENEMRRSHIRLSRCRGPIVAASLAVLAVAGARPALAQAQGVDWNGVIDTCTKKGGGEKSLDACNALIAQFRTMVAKLGQTQVNHFLSGIYLERGLRYHESSRPKEACEDWRMSESLATTAEDRSNARQNVRVAKCG